MEKVYLPKALLKMAGGGDASPTARHHSNSSELCRPGAKSRRWALPLITSFNVIPRQ